MSDCTTELLPCSGTPTGNLFLVLVYSFLLAYGASLIAHGSEILLEHLNPGIIGGLLLPVLGALPDAAIIFVSALGGDLEQVQEQLAIGMGTLAGSNVLLLTLPWAGSIWLAKTDIHEKSGTAKNKIYTQFSFTKTGVTVYRDVKMIARLMIVTLLPYTSIQLSYIILRIQRSKLADAEHWWALGSLIICCVLFIGYSVYQVLDVSMQQIRMDKAKEERMWRRFVHTLAAQVTEGGNVESWLLGYQMPHVLGHSKKIKTGSRRENESQKLIPDEPSGSEDEDVVENASSRNSGIASTQPSFESHAPRSKTWALLRATGYLLGGTGIVLLFADPMVQSIGSLAQAVNLSGFYISFLVTPIASNSSELFSSYAFAKKKTKKTTSLIHSSLYGAVAMNNTISLGVFLGMIFFRQLKWNFSAETLVICFVTISVGLLASFKATIKTYHILWVTALYPISIGLVILLESSYVGWD